MNHTIIHLICNAHLDPVWLWEKEEGIAEVLSTFRVAVRFCRQYDRFVFCHNEAVLYQWVEEHDPDLFAEIQELVKLKKWHIIGGWYLQPDCNMPSGESFCRQIEHGQAYFKEKFGVTPTTAINFDPFGHSRGLVQILKRHGYDSYIFCRPFADQCQIPAPRFTWVGFDGSEITAARAFGGYNSLRGQAVSKLNQYLEEEEAEPVGFLLWGVGNHGGGPSVPDVEGLSNFQKEGVTLHHSTPEAFFAEAAQKDAAPLPRFEKSLNPWAPGCYTSMIRIKQRHRKLENLLYSTETMALHAHLATGMEYPHKDLKLALEDLLFCEFHDILPGSCIQPGEEAALRQMDHGLEILSRIRVRSFLRLCTGQPETPDGEIPILVYNPHPFPVETDVECEYQLADQNWDESYITGARVLDDTGKELPSQIEKEYSNLTLDWRKHLVFHVVLPPSQVSRFTCQLRHICPENNRTDDLTVVGERSEMAVDPKTGLLSLCRVDGKDLLKSGAFQAVVLETDEDPWDSIHTRYGKPLAEFSLSQPPRVIEDGPVRRVIESCFTLGRSRLIITYRIPKVGTSLEVLCRVEFLEESRALKLIFPMPEQKGEFLGETAFGVDHLFMDGTECVSQRFCGHLREESGTAILSDSTYGSSWENGAIGVTLLQTACYSALNLEERPLVCQDRILPHIDMGEREFVFRVQPWDDNLFSSADSFLQPPYSLSFFPSGKGEKIPYLYTISDPKVQVSAFFLREDGKAVMRLFETTGCPRQVQVEIPVLQYKQTVSLSPWEFYTLEIDLHK